MSTQRSNRPQASDATVNFTNNAGPSTNTPAKEKRRTLHGKEQVTTVDDSIVYEWPTVGNSAIDYLTFPVRFFVHLVVNACLFVLKFAFATGGVFASFGFFSDSYALHNAGKLNKFKSALLGFALVFLILLAGYIVFFGSSGGAPAAALSTENVVQALLDKQDILFNGLRSGLKTDLQNSFATKTDLNTATASEAAARKLLEDRLNRLGETYVTKEQLSREIAAVKSQIVTGGGSIDAASLDKLTSYGAQIVASQRTVIEGWIREAIDKATGSNEGLTVQQMIDKAVTNFKQSNRPQVTQAQITQVLEVLKRELMPNLAPASLVHQVLDRLAQDGNVGRPDYALAKFGGSIAGASPPHASNIVFSWFKRLFGSAQQRVETVIRHDDLHPGHCYPMAGNAGFIKIALPVGKKIDVNAVTIDHLHQKAIPSISSAPRKFSVFGHPSASHNRNATLLGSFEYVIDEKTLPTQTFTFPSQGVFPAVRFVFHDNYGNNDFTCIYRLRVHGDAK